MPTCITGQLVRGVLVCFYLLTNLVPASQDVEIRRREEELQRLQGVVRSKEEELLHTEVLLDGMISQPLLADCSGTNTSRSISLQAWSYGPCSSSAGEAAHEGPAASRTENAA